jgi:hypothetical protein
MLRGLLAEVVVEVAVTCASSRTISVDSQPMEETVFGLVFEREETIFSSGCVKKEP